MNLKTKLSISLLGTLLAAAPGYARQLSLGEAIQNAPGSFVKSASRSMPDLLYTESAGDLNVAYILAGSDGEGYVVLAADDIFPAVLGYSDSGSFDASSIPPAMQAWMQEYGRQLTYAVDNGRQSAGVSRAVDHQSIAPLCEALWNQSAPFSDNCPTINGKHCPSGCTATAMAEVMYAHKWPEKGTGVNTYTSAGVNEQLTFDFGATTFDWDNMLPLYSPGYSHVQGAAVATLLEACGNAALMDYGASASGAYTYDALYGMVKFLGYDKSATQLMRDYFLSAEWDNIIYGELAAGRPVIYSGYTSDLTAGHTFVVDGYDKDGYYHLNWGWSGMSNGYFLLTGLDPADQGIGGSSSGYNYYQNALVGIMPAKEGSQARLEVYWNGSFTTGATNYNKTGNIKFIANTDGSGYYECPTIETAKVMMGINLTPVDGGETVFYPGTSEVTFAQSYGKGAPSAYKNFFMSVSSLPSSGQYIATPAFRYDGQVKEVAVKVGEVNSLLLSISSVGVSIAEVPVTRTLTTEDIRVLTPLYTGMPCSISADIHNTGTEYLGMLRVGIANSFGTVLCWLDDVPVSIPDGSTVTAAFSGSLVRFSNGAALEAGDYTISVYNESNRPISDPLSVSISEAPEGDPVFNLSWVVSGYLSGDGSKSNPYITEDQLKIDLTVNVTSGLFAQNVAMYAYYTPSGTNVGFSGETSTVRSYFVGPASSQTQTYTLGLGYFENQKDAYIRPYSTSTRTLLGSPIYVRRIQTGISEITSDNTGLYPNPAVSVTTLTAKAPVSSVDIYSLTGVRVMSIGNSGTQSVELDIAGLQPGHYIVVATTSEGIENYRLIKR